MTRERIHVYEVGPRDGLQNEKVHIGTADKLRLVEGLAAAGVADIEATSFVNPKAVPQMADCSDVYPAAAAHDGVTAWALVINDRGYERAVAAGVEAVALVSVVSDTLCERNNRMTVDESIETTERLLRRAHTDGLQARAYVSPAWVCPYDGPVDPERVLDAAGRFAAAGADCIAISDTIGHARPDDVGRLFEVVSQIAPPERLAAHLHDTQALGLTNAWAAIQAGVRTFDASVGGLGGCPFAPGAAGNLATEDLVFLADKLGYETGIDLDALWSVADIAGEIVGRDVGGRTGAYWRTRTEGTCA